MKKTLAFLLCSILILNIGHMDVSAAKVPNLDSAVSLNSAYSDLKSFESKSGINVIEELNKMKAEFIIELNNNELESMRKIQIQAQIDQLNKSIGLINQMEILERSGESQNKTNEASAVIIVPDLCNNYIMQMSTIVAWFTYQGYKLSAELLTHSFANSSYGSIYVPNPTNTAQIKNTSWFQTAKNGTQPGTSTFESNVDLRYGIHAFEYYFNYDFGTYKYMVISDLYDYTYDNKYSSAAGVANNAMLNAQITGCLTPFTTTIYLVTQ